MKNTFLSFSLIVALASFSSSCAPESEPQDGNVRTISLSASFQNGSMTWKQGDGVSVLSCGKLTKFSSSEVSAGSCLLSGRVFGSGEMTILYPFAASNASSGDAISAELPSSQTAVTDGFDRSALISICKTADVSEGIILRDAVSLVRFTLDESTAGRLSSVSLKSTDGSPLAGKALFGISDGNPSAEVVEGVSEVVLQGPFSAGACFAAVLPGNVKGLKVTLAETSASVSSTVQLEKPLEPGAVLNLGALAFDEEETDYEPYLIDLVFSDGSSFMNPFETPNLLSLSSTMKAPSYPSTRTEMTLSKAKGGYRFYAFGTAGIVRNGGGGLCIGSSAGDYLEFPSVEGMCLVGVSMTSGSTLAGAIIEGADGSVVPGGNVVGTASARGTVVDWTLYGTEIGKSYRLVSAENGTMVFQRLVLKYGPYPKKIPSGKVSPLDFGLGDAKTGEEAYEAIFKAHKAAAGMGMEVDYTGVGTVEITIPANGSSIPLGAVTDFKGTVFKVLNTTRKMALFSLHNTFRQLEVTGAQIDAMDYSSVPELSSGLHILRIQDDSLWVENREGYTYGATRRDVVLVRDGKGSNGPCAPYSTAPTRINATYCDADDAVKSISNATLVRDAKSTVITNFFSITGQNNLHISNITVRTPSGTGIYGDGAIGIQNCTNLLCEDVTFDGLYNDTAEYGYGFSCNNCWNSTFRRMTSHTLWAGFGCNNMNDSHLEDSDVERFDTHCYGKDITILNSTLTGKGIPTASMFGRIYCEKVKFVNCYVYSMRSDYNSYVPFDIVLKDCEFSPNAQTSLINMGRLDTKINSRPELAKKNWPNLEIDGLKINLPSGSTSFGMYYLASNPTYAQPVGYISSVKIKGMSYTVGGKSANVSTIVSRKAVTTENKVSLETDKPGYEITLNFLSK